MTPLIVLLVVSLVLAAFAAAAETSLTSVSRLRMRSLAADGNRRAQAVVRLHNQPNSYLSTILTINTVAVIMASTTTAVLIDQYIHSVPQILGTAVLSLAVLMFCEIAPKSLALHFSVRFAQGLATPVYWLTRLLRPLVGGLTMLARLLLRVATKGKPLAGPYVTEDELMLMLEMSEQEGVVEQDERMMIHGVLDLTDKPVREVMVPRVDIVAAPVSDSVDSVIKLVIDRGYSRIPLYEGNIDNIVSVLYAKDLIRPLDNKQAYPPLHELARPPYFTPDAKASGELLRDMQDRKVHIAIVVDEHGGTAGLVTLEDLLEEIVGPIRDEYDHREVEEIQVISDRELLVNASYPLDDLKDRLDLDLTEFESDTLAGLVYERLGVIPNVGATLPLGAATLTVEAVNRQRVRSVRITSPKPLLIKTNHRPKDQTSEGTSDQTNA